MTTKPAATDATPRRYNASEHKMSVVELKASLETSLNEDTPAESMGLTVEEAQKRLQRDGKNVMSQGKKTPEIVKFLGQFLNPFMLLLMLAAILSYVAYALDVKVKVNLYAGIALCVIVVLQATASYLEERKSAGVMESLKQLMPAWCNVIREGKPRRIQAAELVVGDVVQLKGGDRVPADVRIIQTSGLKVESSSLTGEPDAFELSVTATHEDAHESKNLAFNTSQCTEGSAVAVVIRTADRTLIGMVAALTTGTSNHSSTLGKEIQRVVIFITVLAVVLALIILIVGLAQGMDGVVVANLVITVFVANIPQGLPATVTCCLSIAAKRLSRRNVLVKNLEVIETLGSATCICSDKTGTLTQNKMSVQNFWFNGSFEMLQGGVIVGSTSAVSTTNVLGQKAGTLTRRDGLATNMFSRWQDNPLEPLLLVAAVCNSAKFAAEADGDKNNAPQSINLSQSNGKDQPVRTHSNQSLPNDKDQPAKTQSNQSLPIRIASRQISRQSDKPERTISGQPIRILSRILNAPLQSLHKGEIIGDASETALLRYCESIYPVDEIRQIYRRVYDQPFNSTVKYALSVVEPPGLQAPGKHYVFLKGAPEVVMERCDRWLDAGREKPVDDEFRRRFQEAYERFAHAGERVLGFARKVIDELPSEIKKDMVPTTGFLFLGLASLMDPPKVGVDQAVAECRAAGIRTFMVTGDHALTAEAIAHKVQIITKPTRIDLAHERNVPIEDVDPHDPEIGAIVITGPELRDLSEEEWDHLLNHDEIVFARTTPQQKLEIVEHLQRMGEIVAVTGDGVNDAPALKKANIGVAMGNPNASDVARDAADMIILDDNFCSIVGAIMEGRLLFDNLKKSIAYTLAHLIPEMVPVFLNIILLLPLGLSSMLILTIDLGSELVPAISLAYEDPESAIMLRPPRNIKTDRMVTWQVLFHSYLAAGVMEAVFSMLAFFCIFWSKGIDLQDIVFPDSKLYFTEAAPDLHSGGRVFNANDQVYILSLGNSAVYANIVLCQMFHLWFCRTRATSVFHHPFFSNRLALLAMPWELAFIAIFCYIPQFQVVFTSGLGLPIEFWCLSLGFLAWITIHSETLKCFARRQIAGHKSFLAEFAW